MLATAERPELPTWPLRYQDIIGQPRLMQCQPQEKRV